MLTQTYEMRSQGSIEKRKMSKRLTEEAMAYFDECVSLSTFDSSDFSSQEDAPFELAGVNAYVANNVSSLQASSSASTTNSSNSCFKDKQVCFKVGYHTFLRNMKF